MFTTIRAAIVAFALGATAVHGEELRIGTASLGGAFYPMGQSLSNLVNKYAGDGLTMIPVVTGGSVQNPRLIGSSEVEIAITNTNLAALAINGKGPYDGSPIDLRAIGALHPSVLHMIVLDGSDIRTFEDIKGKRVAVGPAGGGTLGFMNFLLPLHGLSMDDITPSFLSYSDGFAQLVDGNVDAAFALSGYPAGAVMQAAAGHKLSYVRFSDGKLAEAIAKNAAYHEVEIAPEVYGTTEAGHMIGVSNLLIAPTSMDADKVERVTAAFFDHLDELRAENASALQINPDQSRKLLVPLHDGAARYFGK